MLHQKKYNAMFQSDMLHYLEQLPYDVCRTSLYTTNELFQGFDHQRPNSVKECFDSRIYNHFINSLRSPLNEIEGWAQYCHDTSITNALNKMLDDCHPRKVVGIMGGHEMLRTDAACKDIVYFAKKITEMGWLVTTGGGPGAMEAAHLGAWLAGRSQEDVDEALRILNKVNHYTQDGWVSSAYEVYQRFPQESGYRSLAIPTWLFGREPPIFFATDTAKFFSNSIREDTLLSISFGGILFFPGSAGTFREIFQKIVQNHYLVWQYPSPMIFVGKEYWSHTAPFYPVVQDMLKSRQFKNLIAALVDDVEHMIDVISDFENLYPMIRAKQRNEPHAILEILSQPLNSELKLADK